MEVWKRRLAVLAAIGAGSMALITTSAGAQTSPPTSIPTFTLPSIPESPTFPTFTLPPPPTMPPTSFPVTTFPPPPTMPPTSFPVTTITLPPPPTMPPTSFPVTTITLPPPPTMPPSTISPPSVPDLDEILEQFIQDLEGIFVQGEAGFEVLQQILQELLNRF